MQRVIPIMNEILEGKGLVKVAQDKVYVAGLKGPLEAGWQHRVEAFASRIPATIAAHAERPGGAPAKTRSPSVA